MSNIVASLVCASYVMWSSIQGFQFWVKIILNLISDSIAIRLCQSYFTLFYQKNKCNGSYFSVIIFSLSVCKVDKFFGRL